MSDLNLSLKSTMELTPDIGRSLVFDRNIGLLSGGAREEEESEGYRLISNGIAF